MNRTRRFCCSASRRHLSRPVHRRRWPADGPDRNRQTSWRIDDQLAAARLGGFGFDRFDELAVVPQKIALGVEIAFDQRRAG